MISIVHCSSGPLVSIVGVKPAPRSPVIICTHADLVKRGAPSGTRTPNPLIKSQLLCQLS